MQQEGVKPSLSYPTEQVTARGRTRLDTVN